MFGAGNVGKMLKAMKTVSPTSIKKLFWGEFLLLSKIIENYARNYRYR
jgi:hypothetical protein